MLRIALITFKPNAGHFNHNFSAASGHVFVHPFVFYSLGAFALQYVTDGLEHVESELLAPISKGQLAD